MYLSGLSFAVGLSDKTLLSTNLVELSGLGAAFGSSRNGVSVNPNFELKHQLLFKRTAQREWALSSGFMYQMSALNGRYNNGVKRRPNESVGTPVYGWRTRAYLANTLSWLRDNGQAESVGMRALPSITLTSQNSRLFSYRFYNGFDVDLNRRIKLIGEIFTILTIKIRSLAFLGTDVGVMCPLRELSFLVAYAALLYRLVLAVLKILKVITVSALRSIKVSFHNFTKRVMLSLVLNRPR